MNNRLLAYLQLHFAVLLYGLTAILGDLISISALALVWWRVLITSISLLFFIRFGIQIYRMERKLVLVYSGIGFLVAVHWLTFYGAIKYSNASIVLAAMATTSFFTSILEPIITDKKFRWIELGLGMMVIPPMIMIAQNIDLEMKVGLWVGLLSAFLASLFSSLNKKWVDKASSSQITFIEMFSAFLLLSCIMPIVYDDIALIMPTSVDWIYIIILSLLCTTLAFVISMKALKHVSAFDANLVVNLEPVYGILLAIIILKEHQEMNLMFYWGVLLIMLVVFSHPIIEKYFYGKK
jgi:drug/metabolite transporter (DMT)-like permease